MTVIAAWLRLELRRRWRSLAVLALLIAVATGTVVTAAAGARRGASSLQRLSDRTAPATTAVLANTPGFDWTKISRLPEVEALTRFVVDYSFAFEGVPRRRQRLPAGRRRHDAHAGEAGRLRRAGVRPEPGRRGRGLAPVRQELPQGRRRHARPRPGQRQAARRRTTRTPRPGSPARTSGCASSASCSSPWFSDSPGSQGVVVMSPGVVARYPANTIGDPTNKQNRNFVNALVRLRGGGAALPQFRKRRRPPHRTDPTSTSWTCPRSPRQIQRQLSFEARCLLAFAVAAFVASLFLVGQAIVRYAAGSTSELQTLRALGMTPRQAIGTASAGPVIVGVVGAGARRRRGVLRLVTGSRSAPRTCWSPRPGGRSTGWRSARGWRSVALLVAAGQRRGRLAGARRGPPRGARPGAPRSRRQWLSGRIPGPGGRRHPLRAGVRARAHGGAGAPGAHRRGDRGARHRGRVHLLARRVRRGGPSRAVRADVPARVLRRHQRPGLRAVGQAPGRSSPPTRTSPAWTTPAPRWPPAPTERARSRCTPTPRAASRSRSS